VAIQAVPSASKKVNIKTEELHFLINLVD